MSVGPRGRFCPDDCCWHAHGWECAGEYSVQDASRFTRAHAHARFARYEYTWTEVGVWKRYVRPLDRQELYEWWVERNDWRDDASGGGWDEHPDAAPADWQPDPYDEDMPCWEFCHRDHADAIPVWVCGRREDGAPGKPQKRALQGKNRGTS